MEIQIAIAAHKSYEVPADAIYLPLQVGAAGKDPIYARSTSAGADGPDARIERMTPDDTGDNISEKNPQFCELTGLYWIWKNLPAEYSGLVHYRRHFAGQRKFFSKKTVNSALTRRELEPILRETDIVLPRKRSYYIESIYSHYAHSHYASHLDLTREIIGRRCPEYLAAFDRVMRGSKAHMFNMAIMKKDKLDAYCSWLFPILFELADLVDDRGYDEFQKRFPGRVSEMLLDVWIQTNDFSYREVPVIMMGKVHWGRKILSFLAARFFKKRYKQGF